MKKVISIYLSFSLLLDASFLLNAGPIEAKNAEKALLSWFQEGRLNSWMTGVQSSVLNREAPFLLIIQDLHADEQSQLNIANMLRHFMERTGQPLTLFAEGASHEVNPSLFGSFPDASIRENATRQFLKEGWVTGPEYLLISKYDSFPLTIWGIENPDLYAKDFESFRLVHNRTKKLKSGFVSAKKLIRSLKDQLYNPELIEFVRRIERRLSGEIELGDYILALSRRKKFKSFSNLAKYRHFLEKKRKIDTHQLELERSRLAQDLTVALSRERLMHLVQKSMEFRLNRLSELEYYDFLGAEAEKAQIDLPSQFPSFADFLKTLKLQSNVDIWRLSEELQILEKDIIKTLVKSREEKKLEELSRDFQILEDLSELTLMRKDWEFYQLHRRSFKHQALIRKLKFLTEHAQISLSPGLEEWMNSVSFEKHMALARGFYHFACERDLAMTSEALNVMYARKLQQAILVVGGFHTEGVRKILESKGIAYSVVVPKLNEFSGNEIYMTRMMDNRFQKQNLASPSLFSDLMSRLSPLIEEEQWLGLARIYIRGWLQRENMPLSDAILRARFKGLYNFWRQGIERKSPEDLKRFGEILAIVEEELEAENRIQLPSQYQIEKFIKRSLVHAEITLEFLSRFYPTKKELFVFAKNLYEDLYVNRKAPDDPQTRLEKLKQVDSENLKPGTDLSDLLKKTLDYNPDYKDGPSLSLDEIAGIMTRKEPLLAADIPPVDCFLGRIDLSRLNDISRYQGEDARMQLAIDLEIAHLLGLIRIKTFNSNGCVGLASKPTKTIEGVDIQLSWSNFYWLRREAFMLQRLGLTGFYQGRSVSDIVNTDDGQIWFYEQVLGRENIEGSHAGVLYASLPSALKVKSKILSEWKKLQLNFKEVLLLRDEIRKFEQAGLGGEYHGKKVEDIVSSDDGQIWFYEKVFGNDRIRKMYLGSAYSVLPSEFKKSGGLLYAWTKLQLNYEDVISLRLAVKQLEINGLEGEYQGRKVRDIILNDEGQLWFYEKLFGRERAEQMHLGSVYTALPYELRVNGGLLEHWNRLKLNFKDVWKLKTELDVISKMDLDDEYQGKTVKEIVSNNDGQVWFYEKVFGETRMMPIHLETLYSIIPPALKKGFFKNWRMIQVNYQHAKTLRREIARLEALKLKDDYQIGSEKKSVREIVADEEGQLWFYEQVFGPLIKDMQLGRLYTAIPHDLRGTGKRLQNWRMLNLPYGDVILLRSEIRKLEGLGKDEVYHGRKVSEIIGSNEGQIWFYRQVFGSRLERIGYEVLYGIVPSELKAGLLKRWTQPRQKDERAAIEFLQEQAEAYGWDAVIATYGVETGFIRLMFDMAAEKDVSISPYALSAHIRDGNKIADLVNADTELRAKLGNQKLWNPSGVFLSIKKIKSVQSFLKRKMKERGPEGFWKAYSAKGGIHKIRTELSEEQKLEVPPVGLLNALLSKWEFVLELLALDDTETRKALDLLHAQSPWSPTMRSSRGEGLIGNFVTSLNQSVSGPEGAGTKLDFVKDSSGTQEGAYEVILGTAYDVFRNRLKEDEIEKAVLEIAGIVDPGEMDGQFLAATKNADYLLIQMLLGIHFAHGHEFLNFVRHIFQSTDEKSIDQLLARFRENQKLELSELIYVYFIYSETKDNALYEKAKEILEALTRNYKEHSSYQHIVLETFLQVLEEVDFSKINDTPVVLTETSDRSSAIATETTAIEVTDDVVSETVLKQPAIEKTAAPSGVIKLDEAQYLAVVRALTLTRGNVTSASLMIDLSHETMRRIMRNNADSHTAYANSTRLINPAEVIPWRVEKTRRASEAFAAAGQNVVVAAKWLGVSQSVLKKLLEEAKITEIENPPSPDYFYDLLDRPILRKIFQSVLENRGDITQASKKLFVSPQALKAALQKLGIALTKDFLNVDEHALIQMFSYLILAEWTGKYGSKGIKTGKLSEMKKEYLIQLAIQSERNIAEASRISGIAESELLTWLKEEGLSSTLFKPYGKMVPETEKPDLPAWKDYFHYLTAGALLQNGFDINAAANRLKIPVENIMEVISLPQVKAPEEEIALGRDFSAYDRMINQRLEPYGFDSLDLENKLLIFGKVFGPMFELLSRQPDDPELQRFALSAIKALAPEVLPLKRGKKQMPTPAQMQAAFTLLRTDVKFGRRGFVGELMTGEGKTLAIGMAAAIEALKGNKVFVMTPNDFLAAWGVKELVSLYDALGLKVAVVDSHLNRQFLFYKDGTRIRQKRISRQEAYGAHIVYGASSTFVYDFLFDETRNSEEKLQKRRDILFIDEIDNILIDEATNPLVAVVGGRSEIPPAAYRNIYEFSRSLLRGEDYTLGFMGKKINLTSRGEEKLSEYTSDLKTHFGTAAYPRLYEELPYLVIQMLRGEYFYKKNVDYVVMNGQIWVVDEYTGRLQPNRRFGLHIHEALAAKENLDIPDTLVEFNSTTYPRYVRLFKRVAGLTGTGYEAVQEFLERYDLEFLKIEPARPLIREDLPDVIFRTQKEKWDAVVRMIRHVTQVEKRPVLVGVRSIERSYFLDELLKDAGINHRVLNGLQNEEEEYLLVQRAGVLEKEGNGAVTDVTNVAGRGTDIIVEENALKNGGIYILGTERHAAGRIDWQLRGRGGRQGERATSQFFVSLEDEIAVSGGALEMKKITHAAGIDANHHGPIEDAEVNLWFNERQAKMEEENRRIRDHQLSLNDPLEKLSDIFQQFRNDLNIIPGRLSEDGFRKKLMELWHLWETAEGEKSQTPFDPVSVDKADIQELLADEILYDENSVDGLFMERLSEIISTRWLKLWRMLRVLQEQLLQSGEDLSDQQAKYERDISIYWKDFLSGVFRDVQYLSDQGFASMRKQKIEESLGQLIKDAKGQRHLLKELLEERFPKIPRQAIYAFIRENLSLKILVSQEKEHAHLSQPISWLKTVFEAFAASGNLPDELKNGEIVATEYQDRWTIEYAFHPDTQKKRVRLAQIDFDRNRGGYVFVKNFGFSRAVEGYPWLSLAFLSSLLFPLKDSTRFRKTGTVMSWDIFEKNFLYLLEKPGVADMEEIEALKLEKPEQVVIYAGIQSSIQFKETVMNRVRNILEGEISSLFQVYAYVEGAGSKTDDSDGYIQQGKRSSKVFNRLKKRIQENDVTRQFEDMREKFLDGLDALMSRQDLPHIQKAKLLRHLPEIREKIEELKVLGFDGIVKNENDFFLGHMDMKNGALYLATDLMEGLMRENPALALEYFTHEILCPILNHYPSIYIQQYMFPDHYPDLDKKASQAALKSPYKGELGNALRDFIQDKVRKNRQRRNSSDARAEALNIEKTVTDIYEKMKAYDATDAQEFIEKMEDILRNLYPYLSKPKHSFARRQIVYQVFQVWSRSKNKSIFFDPLIQNFENMLAEKGISRDVIDVLLNLAGTKIFYRTLIQLGLEFDKDDRVLSLLLNFYARAYVSRYVSPEDQRFFESRLRPAEKTEFERHFGRIPNCEEWIVQYVIATFFGRDLDFFQNKSNDIETLFFGSGVEELLFLETDVKYRSAHLYRIGQYLVERTPHGQNETETELQNEMVRRLSLPILSLFQDDRHWIEESA